MAIYIGRLNGLREQGDQDAYSRVIPGVNEIIAFSDLAFYFSGPSTVRAEGVKDLSDFHNLNLSDDEISEFTHVLSKGSYQEFTQLYRKVFDM